MRIHITSGTRYYNNIFPGSAPSAVAVWPYPRLFGIIVQGVTIIMQGGPMDFIKVLVVDDEPIISEFIKARLSVEAPHFSITTVESGADCIEYVSWHAVDCILSDFQMPMMNGMELLIRLKELGYHIPFIFITAQGSEEVAREAFKQGASDYFTKDIGFAHFPRIINSVEQAVAQRKAKEAREKAERNVLDYARKLEARTRASLLINMDLDVGLIMRRLVESAIEIVDGASGAAGILKDGRMVFTEYNHAGELFPIDYSFGPGHGVPGHVMATVEPYISDDAINDPHVIKDIQERLGFTTLVDVPILSRDGNLLGCFEIHDKQGGLRFDETDVSLLQGLAASAATAFENARLMEKVESARKEWENTFNVITDIVTIHDRGFKIVKANEAAARAFGMGKDEIVGMKCYDLFHKVGEPATGCPGAELVKSGGTEASLYVEISGRLYEVRVYPVRDGGDVSYFVHVAKDITDIKKTEDVLKGEKTRLEDILEGIADGISIQDKDYRVLYQNSAHKAMIGEHHGDFCYRAYELRDSVCEGCPVAAAFKDGKVHRAERVVVKDGSELHYELVASALRDEGGEIFAGIEVVRDVTEKRRLEARLERSRDFYLTLLDEFPALVWRSGKDGRYNYFNKSWLKFTGRAMEQEQGDGWTEGIHPEDRERRITVYSEALAAKQPLEVEFRLRRHDGQYRWMMDYGRPFADMNGEFAGYLGYCYDVTERKAAEGELAFERAQLLALIENLSEMVYVSDPETYEVLFANRALRQKLRRDPVGGYCYMEFHGYDAPCPFCTNKIIIEEKGKVYKWEHHNPVLNADLLVEDRIIKWPDGRDVRFELAIDITERKNFERQRADFYAMVSHDLKSPLSAIIGYQDLIMDRLKDTDDKDLLEMSKAVGRSSEKLLGMVEDFLAVSRYESGRLSLTKGPVDVGQMVREVAEEFDISAKLAGQEMVAEVAENLPMFILDRRYVERALGNLVQNAVSYTPRGGRITIGAGREARTDGEYLVLSVSDTGPGIPAAEHTRVFEKYFRSSKDLGIRGTGLGLAIVKAVTDAHGGRLELESTEGVGSTFRMLLPPDYVK